MINMNGGSEVTICCLVIEYVMWVKVNTHVEDGRGWEERERRRGLDIPIGYYCGRSSL